VKTCLKGFAIVAFSLFVIMVPGRILYYEYRLKVAICHDDAERVFDLIADGCDPDRLVNRYPLIVFAAKCGSLDVCRVLIESGASVDKEIEPRSRTALVYAILEGHNEVAEFLIKAGADIEREDSTGDTPIIWAVRRNRVRLVSLLLDRGANPNHENEFGMSAITSARDSVPAIKDLLQSYAETER